MEIESLLLFIRIALHLLTGLIIAMWCPDDNTRYRSGVSMLAVCFAGSSFGLAAWLITNPQQSCEAPHAWQTLYALVVFIVVARARGNVAKLLPRLKWDKPV